MKNRAKLKGSGFYLNDDLCSESKRARAKLVPVLKELKIIDKKAHFRGEKIFYNGKLYSEANLHDLPVSAHSSCTKTKDGVTVFAGSLSRLSNLHPCDLTIDGQQYKSVEHYYQHQKALCTRHKDVAERILHTKEPLDVLFLGKDLVTEGTDWNSKQELVMKRGLECKFRIPVMKLAVQQAASVIGEATRNMTWGTGVGLGRVNTFDSKAWPGKNLLGKLLKDIKSGLSA